MNGLQEAFDAGFDALKGYVDRSFATFERRMDAAVAQVAELKSLVEKLEAREPVPGPPGLNGKDGADGKDGRDGIDGKDGAPGERGADGRDGTNGVDGANGRDGADGAPGAPGERGLDGAKGADGSKGSDGADGRDGKDGIGLAGTVIDRDGNLVVTLSDGRVQMLGRVVGRDGIDGKNGQNGINSVKFKFKFENGGRFLLVDQVDPATGETVEQHRLKTEMPVHQGVFRQENEYDSGDMVTFGGSIYLSKVDAPQAKPGGGPESGWQLVVKAGRDGRDAVVKAPEPPKPVKVG